MKEFKLTRRNGDEYIVKVDDTDAELFELYTYHIQIGYSGHPYARRWVKINKGFSYRPLHKEVYERHFGEIPKDKIVDHKDGDSLNNQSDNVRLATMKQNRMNSKGVGESSSQYKGVVKYQNGTFSVIIKHNGIRIFSHGYKDETEAGKLADKIYLALYGEYAHLNFPKVKVA